MSRSGPKTTPTNHGTCERKRQGHRSQHAKTPVLKKKFFRTNTHSNTRSNTHTLHTNNKHNAQHTTQNTQGVIASSAYQNLPTQGYQLTLECTHEGVLDGHTGSKGGNGQFCSPNLHTGLSRASERFTERNPCILHIFSLRIDREQHVPDSSNHSLYLIKLIDYSSPEGHCGGNQPQDGSTCLSPPKPKYNERFTRQTLSMMSG